MKLTDTIAAISTAPGQAGIGVIRISGEDSIKIADKIFRTYNKSFENKEGFLMESKSHTAHFGCIIDSDGNEIDQVLVLILKGPNSFTGENTIEIDCHGGMLVLSRVLEEVIKAGARTAEPGEFTKRAFLNGKMDLVQAEAVMDLIESQNELAHKSSMNQLKGNVSDLIKEIRADILYNIAFIESALDDPEHISLDGYDEKVKNIIESNIDKITNLIDSFDNGRIIKDGIKTVILGKPNAGKSSLLNLLLGEERAIVTDIEGTTRDTLEENVNLSGISLNIVDTAGIRQSDDKVEQIGVKKAKDMAEDADLIIYVIDGQKQIDQNDEEIIDIIKNRQTIVLLNKTDKETAIKPSEIMEKYNLEAIPFSAKSGDGLDELEEEIKNRFYNGKIDLNNQIYITNARHKECLMMANESLKNVLVSIENEMPEDFYSIDLMGAYEKLGLIIGESVEDDLAEEIFSKFCMGK